MDKTAESPVRFYTGACLNVGAAPNRFSVLLNAGKFPSPVLCFSMRI
jgi:hypothetical protein